MLWINIVSFMVSAILFTIIVSKMPFFQKFHTYLSTFSPIVRIIFYVVWVLAVLRLPLFENEMLAGIIRHSIIGVSFVVLIDGIFTIDKPTST